MTILRALTRPEYVFRPSQVWRRLRRPWSHALPEMATVIMPWGWPLQVRTQETIGRLVWTFGVFDLAVSEVLWRLAEPGDTVVDAGANVGCMSCVLAARLGSRGTVLAFEPFAQVHAELQANVESWKALEPKLAVRLFSSALRPRSGRAVLDAPGEREQNRGLAKVEAAEGGEGDIVVEALDDILGADGRVGVLKIDVEGGELGRVFKPRR